MFQDNFFVHDDLPTGCDDDLDASADPRVVRDPEIVWFSDVRYGVFDGGVRSIPEKLAGIEAALGRFDPGHAEDLCWEVWSLSREAGAFELANAVELLALSLDSNAQLFHSACEEQRTLLEVVRACSAEMPKVRNSLTERAA